MPQAEINGVRIFYTTTGSGDPIVFVHEFAGDHRSWEPQLQYFSRRYRCIAFNARGYPPSMIPRDISQYNQMQQADDIAAVIHAAGLANAHLVGLSMGSFAALHFALRYPRMARSVILAGTGYGALPADHDRFANEARELADQIEQKGLSSVTANYAISPSRLPFKRKNPRGWQAFASQLAHHDPEGLILTLRGYQATRPALTDFTEQLQTMTTPVLVIAGDEDESSLDASLFLKRTIPSAALAVLPHTGHTLNLEEPSWFNELMQDFLTTIDTGHWQARD